MTSSLPIENMQLVYFQFRRFGTRSAASFNVYMTFVCAGIVLSIATFAFIEIR